MKKKVKFIMLFTILFFVLTNIYSQQIPETFNYQAVAHLKNGKSLVNKEIVVEISILKGISTEEIEYQEVHYPVTNDFGLFNIEIGNGINTFAGNTFEFSEIDWFSDDYFLKTRIDFGDDEFLNGLTDMGISKFQSVPYALSSKRAVIADNVSLPTNINLIDLADVNVNFPLDNQVIAWDSNNQKWIAADPTGDEGVFLRTDGSADLTNDWTVNSNDIILTNGNIFINSGKLQANEFQLNTGNSVTEISTDGTFSGNSDNIIVTEKAIKTYVNSMFTTWTVTDLYIYNNDLKNIGIGTETPEDKFHIELDISEGILFSGNFGGFVPDLNAGTRMTFYPAKASFRAGRIENQSDFWNNENVGDYSVGFGYDTKASGDYSFVSGRNNQANGNYSFVAGRDNNTNNTYAISFGQNNNSSGLYSFTNGANNTANGVAATVFGSDNIAHGNNSFVFGLQCITGSSSGIGGDNSFAFGEFASAEGNSAFAFGYQSVAKGEYSFASGENTETSSGAKSSATFGKSTTTYGDLSISGGFNTKARSYAETVFGRYNFSLGNTSDSWVSNEALFVIGNGTNSEESNAFVILKNGNIGIGIEQNSPNYLLEVGKNGDGTEAIANSWQTFSDKRLNKNFTIINNPVEKLLMINGYYYFEKTGKNKLRQIGFIAQEIEKILPETVSENKKGYKSVDYSKLTPLIIETVKKQQIIIKNLETKNKKLENKINKLQKRIENIEKYIKEN